MRKATLWGAAIALLLAGVAYATTVKRLPLDEVVKQSSEVFVGTVRDTRAVPGERGREPIYTEVTFEKLDVVKGAIRGSTTSYRFAGGTLNGRTLVIHGMPKFDAGKRYVLFTNAAEDWICPAVGWWQGRFTVKRDPVTGTDRVHDSDGKPVYGFSRGAPLLRPLRRGESPLRLDAFLTKVRRTIARQAREAAEQAARERARKPEKPAKPTDPDVRTPLPEQPPEEEAPAPEQPAPKAERKPDGEQVR